jgi:hypothetical protein
MEIKYGSTRMVILTRHYAIKIPSIKNFVRFLYGLLGNIQETSWSKINHPDLCPVLFHLPLGLLIIMPRCREIDPSLIKHLRKTEWRKRKNIIIPVEYKADSFGYWKNRLVAIDYGGGICSTP